MTLVLQRPSTGPLTSPFGPRPAPLGYHHGIDFGWYKASPDYRIEAAAAGTVSQVTRTSTMGRYTKIDHGNGYQTAYAHQAAQLVKVGQKVTAGEHIGTMGADGTLAAGTHLHFELWHNGVRIDPAPYMTAPAGGGIPIVEGNPVKKIYKAVIGGKPIWALGDDEALDPVNSGWVETRDTNVVSGQWAPRYGNFILLSAATFAEYRIKFRAPHTSGSGGGITAEQIDALAVKVAAAVKVPTLAAIAKAVNDDAAARLKA